MLVTPVGIVMLFSASQESNAQLPMLVTLSGIVTLVNALHPLNAFSPMPVTPVGIVYAPVLLRGQKNSSV